MVVASVTLCYTAVAASRSVPGLFSEGGASAAAAAAASRVRADSCDEDDAGHAASAPRTSVGSKSRLLDAEGGGSTATKYAAHEHAAAAPPAAPQPLPYSMFSSAIFLLTLILASLYSAMVLTNWAVNATDVVTARNSTSSMWAQVRLSSSFILVAEVLKVAPSRTITVRPLCSLAARSLLLCSTRGPW